MYYTKEFSMKCGEFCSGGFSIRELYDMTFILVSSFSWKRTAPNPISEASAVLKKDVLYLVW